MTTTPRLEIRDATAADLPALAELRGSAVAAAAFEHERLLLAEDPAGAPLALLRLCAGQATPLPRFWFRVGLAVHAAAALGINHRQRTLLLGNDLAGLAELRQLSGEPAALLALVRAALDIVAAAPDVYRQRVFAELPGVIEPGGEWPFWQGLGRHFHAATPPAHDGEWPSHVAALLPRQVIYASFLSDAAQAAIGGCAAHALSLRDTLLAAGLRWQGQVGIVDGGAVLEVDVG